MRYFLRIMGIILLLGAHNLYGTLKPQQWGATDVPSEWSDALSERIKDMGKLANQSDRVQSYLSLLHAVCNEKNLSPEEYRALLAKVKDEVFQCLLNEVKSSGHARDARSNELAKYVMTAARVVRDLDMESDEGLRNAEQRLTSLMQDAAVSMASMSRAHLFHPDSREIPYADYMRMRSEKREVLENARSSASIFLAASAVIGTMMVMGFIVSAAWTLGEWGEVAHQRLDAQARLRSQEQAQTQPQAQS